MSDEEHDGFPGAKYDRLESEPVRGPEPPQPPEQQPDESPPTGPTTTPTNSAPGTATQQPESADTVSAFLEQDSRVTDAIADTISSVFATIQAAPPGATVEIIRENAATPIALVTNNSQLASGYGLIIRDGTSDPATPYVWRGLPNQEWLSIVDQLVARLPEGASGMPGEPSRYEVFTLAREEAADLVVRGGGPLEGPVFELVVDDDHRL